MSFNYIQPFMTLGNGLNTLQTGGIGGWVELARTTLGATSDTITVSSLENKRYYMVLTHQIESGQVSAGLRMGNGSIDTGSNYSFRYERNNTEFSSTSQTFAGYLADSLATQDGFSVGYITNISANEKPFLSHGFKQGTTGAAAIGARYETTGKWTNTSNVIDTLQTINFGSGDMASGSEMVILGYDENDTHTNNYWESLASVNATGSSTNLSSGTILSKKYLWVQCWLKNTTSHTSDMTFNNDTTTYSYRNADNGAADGTSLSDSHIELYSATTTPIFCNMFIFNSSSREKLVIGHTINQNTAGATSAPNRREFIGKYDSTSAAITEIDIDSSSGNWDSTSIINVWGAD